MAIDSADALVAVLCRGGWLNPVQERELTQDLRPRHADVRSLARGLLERGWLTPFQLNQLLQGRAAELLVGPYVLLERLGEGGTGQVFKARHQHMNRVVALKLIRKDLVADPEVVGRFQREVHSLSQLSHPHIVQAHDAGPYAGGYFLAMEYVEGTELGRLVKERGQLPVAEACTYVRQAALGLQHLHERGLVHRDIKPSNLLLTGKRERGTGKDNHPGCSSPLSASPLVKILDLGLARLHRPLDEATAALTTDNPVTMGTLDYMAPEQAIDFHQTDIRADIYSLGCTLYFLLTGQPPFPGGTAAQKLLRQQQAEPPPLEKFRRDLPPELARVVAKMMAKRPDDRYQTPLEVVQELAAPAPSGNLLAAISAPAALPAVRLPGDRLAPVAIVIDSRAAEPVRRRLKLALEKGYRACAGSPGRAGAAAAVALLVLFLAVWIVPWGSKGSGTNSSRGEHVYLADLKEVRATTADRLHPFAKGEILLLDAALIVSDRRRIVVNNVFAPKGLFTFPASNGTADVVYALNGQYKTFHVVVGVDDSTTSPSDLYFSVAGDGRVLWRSKPVRKKGDQQACEVDVRSVRTLELVVQGTGPNTDNKNNSSQALAVWADPYVTK